MDYEENRKYEILDVFFAKITLCAVFIHLYMFATIIESITSVIMLFLCLIVKDIASRFDNASKEYQIGHTFWHIGVFLSNIIVAYFIW